METIRIYCENDQSYHQVPLASDLQTIAAELAPADTLAALVDNQLKELSYQVLNTHTIRFIGYVLLPKKLLAFLYKKMLRKTT